MLCLNCGKEVAGMDAKCGSCGSSLFINKRALHDSLTAAGGVAPAKKFELPPKKSCNQTLGIVLGVAGLLVFLIIVIPNLLRSRLKPHFASAVGSLRTINTTAATYASTYNRGFPRTLAALAPPKSELPNAYGEPSEKAAGLIDDILASGTKGCYRFSYIAGPVDSSGKILTYTVHADPIEPCAESKMHYFTDQTGVVREEKDREAYASSPPIAG